MIKIDGKQIIGFSLTAEGTDRFHSYNPALGVPLEYSFVKATVREADLACEKAASAFQVYRKKSGNDKAMFLDAIAQEIFLLGDALIEVCCLETALPKARIEGERGRTINQLRLFARVLREGSWRDARIETAEPGRVPVPKPDIRSLHTGVGPVVVFGASNFPLAFSVAGGDTASALAAGCPVIVKVHSAHPATGELVGKAIQRAAQSTYMPDGVFSMLHGDGSVIGTQLVKNKHMKAVGLTGSFQAGKALFDIAAQREEPIPVYAEMGSSNPVFVLPEAMKLNAARISQGYSASVTLGVGQFCTNPGLLFHQQGDGSSEFISQIKTEFEKTTGGAMLTENIFKSYTTSVARHASRQEVELLAIGARGEGAHYASPALFKTQGDTLYSNPELSEEVFGPASVVVEMKTKNELLEAARNLKGHLTATVHGTEHDLAAYTELLAILEQKAGRIVVNAFPTGVEVCHAMVHGGPYPATTDGRSTSVGTAAIYRFTRLVCYQDMPSPWLPPELQNENPLGVWRLINGEWTKDRI
jgi:alpha-ketoglutaric semialdehyde dehydrogenase